MGMSVSRTADPLRFDVGIGKAGYADVIDTPSAGEPQKSLLPGTTTVSQALDELFPQDRSVDGEVMRAMVAGVGDSASGRSSSSRSRRSALVRRRSRPADSSYTSMHAFSAEMITWLLFIASWLVAMPGEGTTSAVSPGASLVGCGSRFHHGSGNPMVRRTW